MSTLEDLNFESEKEKQEDILSPKQGEAFEKVANITNEKSDNEKSDFMKQVDNTSESQTELQKVIYEKDGALKKITEGNYTIIISELNQATNEKNIALKSVETLSAGMLYSLIKALEKITSEKAVGNKAS